MRYLVTIIFILGSFFTVFSQAPGYMGKNWMLNGDYYFMSALLSPNANHKTGILKFNTYTGIGLDYVHRRFRSVGFTVQFFKTSAALDEFVFDNGSEKRNVNLVDMYSDISGRIFTLNLKFFKKNTIAPMGRYVKTEIGFVNFSAKYDTAEFSRRVYGSGTILQRSMPDMNSKKSYNLFCMAASFGSQRILADRLVINYSIRFGVALALKGDIGYSINPLLGTLANRNWNEEEDYLQSICKARIMSHYLCNINLGLGWLLF